MQIIMILKIIIWILNYNNDNKAIIIIAGQQCSNSWFFYHFQVTVDA